MTPGIRSTAAPVVVSLRRVDSTQRVALDLAAAGAADRTVVVAEVQTAGRGRRGRVWEAAPGTSLLASILIRPTPSESTVLYPQGGRREVGVVCYLRQDFERMWAQVAY